MLTEAHHAELVGRAIGVGVALRVYGCADATVTDLIGRALVVETAEDELAEAVDAHTAWTALVVIEALNGLALKIDAHLADATLEVVKTLSGEFADAIDALEVVWALLIVTAETSIGPADLAIAEEPTWAVKVVAALWWTFDTPAVQATEATRAIDIRTALRDVDTLVVDTDLVVSAVGITRAFNQFAGAVAADRGSAQEIAVAVGLATRADTFTRYTLGSNGAVAVAVTAANGNADTIGACLAESALFVSFTLRTANAVGAGLTLSAIRVGGARWVRNTLTTVANLAFGAVRGALAALAWDRTAAIQANLIGRTICAVGALDRSRAEIAHAAT